MERKAWGMFGRDAEMARFLELLSGAEAGSGRTVAVTGEPGSGKSRLVEELFIAAKTKRFRVVSGAFSKEAARPYEAFCRALGDDILGGEEKVGFAQMMVIDASGLLMAKASPEGSEDVDSDIFAGMLTAVQNFVKDSFGGSEGSLGRLEYGEMKIVMEAMGPAILVAFFKGAEHPDMAPLVRSGARRLAESQRHVLESWGGRTDAVAPLQREIERLASSKFMVRRDFSGVKLERERLRIADLILNRLLTGGGHEPTLLVLEDAHWADGGSMHALDYVARNCAGGSVLVVATARPTESKALDEALAKAISEGYMDSLAITGISREAISALLAKEFSPNDFPEAFADKLASECRGNPFFLTEVLRQMAADGAILQKEGAYSLSSQETHVPKSVDELVQRRLDSLEPDAIALAEYASCAGREFPVAAALSMRSLKEPALSLEKLKASGIVNVSEAGDAEFSHAFYRDALYANIVPRWKNVYHKGLGEHYERAYEGRLDEAAYELARHFFNTSDDAKAFKYSTMAGLKAESSYAVEQALEYYDKAISRAKKVEPAEVSGANERAGDLLILMGRYDDALARYRLASESISDVERSAQLGVKRSITFEKKAEYQKSLDELDALESDKSLPDSIRKRICLQRASVLIKCGNHKDALAIANEIVQERRAISDSELGNVFHTAGVASWYSGDYDRALEYFSEGLLQMEKIGNLQGLANTYNNIGVVNSIKGDFTKALEFYQKGLDIRKKIGDQEGISASYNNIGISYWSWKNTSRAIEAFKKSLEIAQRIGDREGAGSTLNNIGNGYIQMGDVGLAMDAFVKSLEVRRSIGNLRGVAAVTNNIGFVLLNKGDLDDAERHIQEGLKIREEIDDKRGLVSSFENMGRLEFHRGNFNESVYWFKKSYDLCRALGITDSLATSILGMAEAKIMMGEREDIEDLFKSVENEVAKSGFDDFPALLGRTKGAYYSMLGDKVASDMAFKDAIDKYEALNMGVEADITRFKWASVLAERGENAKAAELAEAARKTFASKGLGSWESKTQALIERLSKNEAGPAR